MAELKDKHNENYTKSTNLLIHNLLKARSERHEEYKPYRIVDPTKFYTHWRKYDFMMGSVKFTVGASDEATKSESSGDDIHNDCECIDTVNLVVGSITFYTTAKLSLFLINLP